MPLSSMRPAGHQPPHGKPSAKAASRAARSTPVWPPEMILMGFGFMGGLANPGEASPQTTRKSVLLEFDMFKMEIGIQGLHRLRTCGTIRKLQRTGALQERKRAMKDSSKSQVVSSSC